MPLTKQFRSALLSELNRYQKLFPQSKAIKLHRGHDVANLRVIINNRELDAEDVRDQVQEHLKIMQTGFCLFATGHSRLKEFISNALSKSEFSELSFFRETIQGLEQELGYYRTLLDSSLGVKSEVGEGMDQSGLVSLLKNKVAGKDLALNRSKALIANLKTTVANLTIENGRLSEEKTNLTSENKQLKLAQQSDAANVARYKPIEMRGRGL